MIVNKFYIYSFYCFENIKNKKHIKYLIEDFLHDKIVRGTIILADEGINASISGAKIDLENIISFIKQNLIKNNFEIKIHEIDYLPFNRMKVRIKNEIVSLGQGEINVNKFRGKLVGPAEWNKLLLDTNTLLIDTRNSFEITIGKFKNSIDLDTFSFREFPKKFKSLKLKKNTKIAMYCTGGIRCEKASAYLKQKGYKNVLQLNGGILNYLKYIKNKSESTLWKGECFVFDDRVTVNKKLSVGKYLQCYGCKRPITKKEKLSIYYKKGVSCPYCFNERNEKQKHRSETRQKQINKMEKENLLHSFSKIKIF